MERIKVKELFGRNLKYYRFKKGLSQEQLAEKIDTTVTYISNIETGRNGVTFTKVEEFCNVLGIKPSQLFDEGVYKKEFCDRLDLYKKRNKA
ncbi:MAG: helix-turn-helix transcriptional regulator [Bacilli bacterium]